MLVSKGAGGESHVIALLRVDDDCRMELEVRMFGLGTDTSKACTAWCERMDSFRAVAWSMAAGNGLAKTCLERREGSVTLTLASTASSAPG